MTDGERKRIRYYEWDKVTEAIVNKAREVANEKNEEFMGAIIPMNIYSDLAYRTGYPVLGIINEN